MEVELEDTKILWPGGVLYGGGETYENGPGWVGLKVLLSA